MDVLKERYSITELSQYLNVTDHTLRFYEKEFQIKVPKDDRGRRYYNTDLANIMYQIKTMRDEGLEIKAIRKILQRDNVISEPDVITPEVSLTVPYKINETAYAEFKSIFLALKDEISCTVTNEFALTKEHISKELTKNKLELGACIENNMRKLETKMDKHFQDVDDCLTKWRKKNQSGIFKKLIGKAFQKNTL
ncbi:MerR family transcriptional regulator [Pseudobacteroides cellulosolvens]|uniref:Transcriptional regulator, MerR family n=1 Tax=Pseudobacteroides cellulosolvens ATCC 35603 = DSM 2933 TaxID=398512 RepID=A0A0L6JLQ0_9FIRM|nr:MerR family transcriptional regulator [Pseudobacteroides cellulosolvens]KNY26675.1 transcriptional regulator, MerR family [Pseudobacteroides cellulosolvens ATCC 35603 = DSM 2933]